MVIGHSQAIFSRVNRRRKMSLGLELSAVVFGQYVHQISVCDFFFWGYLKDKVYNSSP
jgi:hypothetical protein